MPVKSLFNTILIFLLLSHASAQEALEMDSTEKPDPNQSKLMLSAGTRVSACISGNTYDFPSLFSEFQMNSQFRYQKAEFAADIRLRTGLQFDETFNKVEIKELYAAYQTEKIRIHAGNQIVVWGRTDGFNTVNYLAPADYFFLSSDPDDQLMSNFMVRFRYQLNKHIDVDLIGIPVYKSSIYRYDLFRISEYVTFGETQLPATKFDHASLAGRMNFEFSAAGFSVSYFQGYDPFHGFDLKQFNVSATGIEIMNTPQPYYKRSAGLDFEAAAGSALFRGEASYNHTHDYTERMYVPNPEISYIAAVERDISGITAVLQYAGKFTLDYSKLVLPDLSRYDLNNPADLMRYAEDYTIYEMTLFNRKIFHQEHQTDHALMLILAGSFFYETVNAELSTLYNLTTEELLLRPAFVWKTNDHLKICVGGVFMHGPKNSLFDYSSRILSGMCIEMNVKL